MNLSDCASFFDDQDVFDGYTGALLFKGQPDLYDNSIRDSSTGWRRTVSSGAVVASSRGVFRLGTSARYMAGRVVRDYALGAVIREHVLLHPCDDGLFGIAPPSEFLKTTPAPTTFYGAVSWEKLDKEEAASAQFFNQVSIYSSTTESGGRGLFVQAPTGVCYRIQSVNTATGGLRRLVCSELSASPTTLVYTPAGVYNPVTDSRAAGTPVTIKGFLERYQSAYHYLSQASTPFENGDRVLTLAKTAVASPAPGDTIPGYRSLGAQDDTLGGWALHMRPL